MDSSVRLRTGKRAILHIGTHKTGTTALQQFFTTNAQSLRSFGLHYPLDMPEGVKYANGHHYIAWLLAENWKRLSDGGYPDDYCGSFQERLLSAAGELTLLLSSEAFSLLSDEQVAKLGRVLLGFDVKVVLYVRRQDEYLQALYQTKVIHDDHHLAIDAIRKEFPLDYYSLARRWARVFGHANVVVRVYESGQLVKGNVVDDFRDLCRSFGYELPSNTPLDRVNQGFPSYYVELAKMWAGDKSEEKEIWDAVQRLAWRLYPQGAGKYWFLRPSQCEGVLADYASANSALAAEFLRRTDGVLFRDLSVPMDDGTWEREFGSPERILVKFLKDTERRIYDLEVSLAQQKRTFTS